jgi:NAD(P)-dependent dehydrogenase (short-subunit alcohol dehydrogenase family)
MPLPRSPHVVITGAGSGFGRALALALSGAPWHARLVLSDIQEATAAETAKLALAAGAKEAKSLVCDVSKLDQVEALAAAATSAGFGPIDLVVNNAGVSSGGRIGEAPIADWRWTIEIDLFGVIYGCHVFVPILRKQGHGHVLNMASAAGLIHPPQMGAYNVAKAGVVALSETLAAELVQTKIGVTVLCPTFFQTDIVKSGRFKDEATKQHGQKVIDAGKSPESVAKAALTAVAHDRFYCVPMLDGRMAWRVKRVVPQAFSKMVGKAALRRLPPE